MSMNFSPIIAAIYLEKAKQARLLHPEKVVPWAATAHYLDSSPTLKAWYTRAPLMAYPTMVAVHAGLDVSKAKPEERNKTLAKDAITLGLPLVATLFATHWLMKPKVDVIPTTQAAIAYLGKHYNDLLPAASQEAKRLVSETPAALQKVYWGAEATAKALAKPLSERLQTAPEHLLDVEVQTLTKGLAQRFKQQEALPDFASKFAQRSQALLQSAQHMVVELAHQAEPTLAESGSKGKHTYKELLTWAREHQPDLPLLEWPAYMERHLAKNAKIKGDWLLKQELRLALPIEDNFGEPQHLFNTSPLKALSHTAKETWHNIIEDAMPFFATGAVSIASGVGAGLLANKVFKEPTNKNTYVVKEGVFQFVANVCMCALGASGGMATANLLGFSKFNAPVARFSTISAGLLAGIAVGAKSANVISDEWLGPLVDKAFHVETHPEAGRKISGQDMVLHFDDLPTALALSGLNLLKPFISPFFFESAIKTAQGYRNIPAPVSASSNAASTAIHQADLGLQQLPAQWVNQPKPAPSAFVSQQTDIPAALAPLLAPA